VGYTSSASCTRLTPRRSRFWLQTKDDDAKWYRSDHWSRYISTIPHIIIRFQAPNSVAGSGIGQATAIAYARAGCQSLTLVDMNAAGLQKTKELIKSSDETIMILDLLVDVSDETAVEDMVKKTVDTFGGVDHGKSLTAKRFYKFSHYAKLSMSLA